jgi:hypothetical protein
MAELIRIFISLLDVRLFDYTMKRQFGGT